MCTYSMSRAWSPVVHAYLISRVYSTNTAPDTVSSVSHMFSVRVPVALKVCVCVVGVGKEKRGGAQKLVHRASWKYTALVTQLP